MNEPAVAVAGLTKTFTTARSKMTAVDNIDFTVPVGQIVALLGPNGAGKSTTIDMILGLTKPDSGSIRVLGGDPGKATRSGRCQAVYQSGGLLSDFTVAETAASIAAAHRRPERAKEVIDQWDLGEFASRKVGKCSGGQQQRLRFALAMIPDPQVLILDEPTTGLDVDSRRSFWKIMAEEATRGRTIIFATHYIEEADDFAQRVMLLSRGRIVADGPIETIRESVSGSTVSCTVDKQYIPAIEQLSGTTSVDQASGRTRISTNDSDGLARHLLNHTDAAGLEITTTTLEDAFVKLTGPEQQEAA